VTVSARQASSPGWADGVQISVGPTDMARTDSGRGALEVTLGSLPWASTAAWETLPIILARPFTVSAPVAEYFYAAWRQLYRWWRPARHGLDITIARDEGFCSTGSGFGVSFSRES